MAGDEWLQHRLTPDQLARFELVVIPEHSNATGEQAALLDRWREQSEAVAWTGVDHVRSRVRPLITLTGAEKVWTLPRKKPSQPGRPTMIHLLNQDYDANEDAMRMKAGFQVSIDGSLTDNAPAECAILFAPGREPQSLDVTRRGDGVFVTVPFLDLWAILKLE